MEKENASFFYHIHIWKTGYSELGNRHSGGIMGVDTEWRIFSIHSMLFNFMYDSIYARCPAHNQKQQEPLPLPR